MSPFQFLGRPLTMQISITPPLLLTLCFSIACSTSFNPFEPGDTSTIRTDTGPAPDAAQTDSGPLECAPLPNDCEPQVMLVDSCGTSACHGSDQEYTGSDYESGDVFGRLLGLPSGQFGGGAGTECSDIPVIDGDDPANSMLLRTLRGTQGACGDRMPFDGAWRERDISCIDAWIRRELCLRRNTPGVDAGVSDAGSLDGGPRPDAGRARQRPLDERDPQLLTAEEAACLGLDASGCVGCHLLEDTWYGRPYWTGDMPRDVTPLPDCSVPVNIVNEEAASCFGFDHAPCASCHQSDDGNIYLRPWYAPPMPPVTIDIDASCYDLL